MVGGHHFRFSFSCSPASGNSRPDGFIEPGDEKPGGAHVLPLLLCLRAHPLGFCALEGVTKRQPAWTGAQNQCTIEFWPKVFQRFWEILVVDVPETTSQ